MARESRIHYVSGASSAHGDTRPRPQRYDSHPRKRSQTSRRGRRRPLTRTGWRGGRSPLVVRTQRENVADIDALVKAEIPRATDAFRCVLSEHSDATLWQSRSVLGLHRVRKAARRSDHNRLSQTATLAAALDPLAARGPRRSRLARWIGLTHNRSAMPFRVMPIAMHSFVLFKHSPVKPSPPKTGLLLLPI